MKIIIPARFGSKGFPFKNRKLFKYTADIIPNEYQNSVWVSSDDQHILSLAESYNFNIIERPKLISDDRSSIKKVIQHSIKYILPKEDELIVMLYLTYPNREWNDVKNAIQFFNKNKKAHSLLCKKEVKSHPYLCLFEDGVFGKQIVEHNLYRRQDYPKCFELSHYISIINPKYLDLLNDNLYNEKTIYYKINEVDDIDYEYQYQKILNKK